MKTTNYSVIYSRFESFFRDGRYLFTLDNLTGEYKLYKRIPDKRCRNGYRYDLYFSTQKAMAMISELSLIRRFGL